MDSAALQIVRYNNLRLGPSDDDHKVLIDQIDPCPAKYGQKFKEEGSKEFVNTPGDTYIQPPLEWGPADYYFFFFDKCAPLGGVRNPLSKSRAHRKWKTCW